MFRRTQNDCFKDSKKKVAECFNSFIDFCRFAVC